MNSRVLPVHFFSFLMIWSCFSGLVSAQNLVPNPNFETYSACPSGVSNIVLAVPWIAPSLGTSDFFHMCSTSPQVDVPYNFPGYQPAFTGEGYAGCYTRAINALPQYREYIQARLLSPLEEGICYHVGFFVNLTNNGCATQHMGAYISEVAPYNQNGQEYFDLNPQIENDGGFMKDTVGWTHISGFFVAKGGEEYITIGNFYPDNQTPLDPACSSSFSYYYIDSVYVEYEDVGHIIDVDLGGPIDVCTEYTIDPQIPNVQYTWEDGSHNETFYVNQDGTYNLTVTEGCSFGEDSIEIQIIGSDPVDIPPSAAFCQGDSYTISLDILAGAYMWSNGSNENEIEITTPGTYTVTLNDGCDMTTDQIVVDVTLVPDPIDLGPDQLICEGEEITLSVNPNIGDNVHWQNGSSSSTYTIIESGTYSVTISNPCGEESDEMEVVLIPLPEIDLGESLVTICPSDIIEFEFDPSLGDFVWSDGSTTSFFSIEDPGLYSVTLTNSCGMATDEIVVQEATIPDLNIADTIHLCPGELPYAILLENLQPGDMLHWSNGATTNPITVMTPGELGVTVTNTCYVLEAETYIELDQDIPVLSMPDSAALCETDFLEINLTNPLTSFLWQDGSTASHYVIEGPGVYSVTATNSCGSSVDSIIVVAADIDFAPDLGPDISICPGQEIILYANVPGVNYEWQDLSTADSLLVSSPGVYFVTAFNSCGSSVDSIVVIAADILMPPDLGPDISICPGQQVILYANVPGINYLWQDMSTADSLLVSSPGEYAVTVTDMCQILSDTVQIIFNNNPPQVDLPSSIVLCENESIQLESGITGVSYLWNDLSTGSSVSVVSPGIYSLTVSNGCGSSSDSTLVTSGGSLPYVDLGTDLLLCDGETFLLTPVHDEVDLWSWSDGSSDSSLLVISSGLVAVHVSNNCGDYFDTLEVSYLPPLPAFSIGADTALCPGEVLILSIDLPSVNMVWSDGSTGDSLSVDQPGTYFVSISNSCDESADSIVVTALPDIPLLLLGPDQKLCPGEVILLDPGIPDVQYEWQDGSNGNTFSTTQEGTFYLTISNECGIRSDTLEVIESTEGPQVNLGPDTLACEGTEIVLMADISGVSYQWQDGSTLSSFITNASGTFVLTVSNSCGVDADTVLVDIHGTPPDGLLGSDTTLCENVSLLLTIDTDNETTIEWQDGSDANTFLVQNMGTYFFIAINRCGVNADTISVEYQSPPLPFELGPDTTLCPGESILLYAPVTKDDIEWQDGTHGQTYLADKGQFYSLKLANACGVTSDGLTLQFDDRAPKLDLDSLFNLCPGESIDLDVTQPFAADYTWSNGSHAPLLHLVDTGTYSVLVEVPCAQANGEAIVIQSDSCFANHDIYIPNVFSPNGDGINDVFSVFVNQELDVLSMETSIFDRWGNLVFHSEDPDPHWQGDFRGRVLNPAVFVYRVIIRYKDLFTERSEIFSGDVTLIR